MKKFLKSFLIMSLLLGSYSQVSAQYLHADGTKIVDESGNEVIWRGIGLGGWMLQEGYMLRTSGPQHEIEMKVKNLVGEDKKQQFYDKWLMNHTRKIDVDSMAAWGYNLIRLPMHYKLFTPPIEEEPVAGEVTWNTKGFEMVDELLEWCKVNNIYLILDLHAAPGGQGENKDISDYDPSKPSLWESEKNQAKTIALWRKLAERYKDEPMIAAYDLLNEPNWGFQNHSSDLNGCSESQNTPLWKLQKDITAAIREVDTKHIIVIEGNCWGNNYSGLPTLWDNNLVISYHKYWNGNEQSDIQGLVDMRNSRKVPIWLGETGENSNSWFTDCIALLESNGIGWSWWPLKKLGGNNPLQIPMNDGYQKVVDYWNGSGAKPSEADAFTALMQLAEDLKLENNIYHLDVVDAKIRQPHSNETKPFKNHKIVENKENVILACDYDLGRHGFAYQDNDYTNISGGAGGTAWNLGYSYRNDGVDIESTSDTDENGNGYNVGWTNVGEWMQYTVDVDTSGAFDLVVRYAGQGQIHLEVDGLDITGTIDLPSTGGYQVWDEKKVPQVLLYKGTRKIKLVIDKGGFNLNYVSFFLTNKLSEISLLALSASTENAEAIILNFNKAIDKTTVIDPSNFAISVDGVAHTPTQVTASDNDFSVIIKTDVVLNDDNAILVAYDGTNLKGADGSVLAAFSALEVRNKLPIHLDVPGKIEAEAFFTNQGLVFEKTEDTGGGQNLGYTSVGDYLDFRIFVKETGSHSLDVRVACNNNSGKLVFQQLNSEGAVLNSVEVDVPVTGGWQTWKTISTRMDLTAGRGVLRMKILDPEFNLNWFRFGNAQLITAVDPVQVIGIFPNPSSGYISISVPISEWNQDNSLKISDLSGRVVIQKKHIPFSNERIIDLNGLNIGVYFISFRMGAITHQQKLIVN
jgi:endoglucanase